MEDAKGAAAQRRDIVVLMKSIVSMAAKNSMEIAGYVKM